MKGRKRALGAALLSLGLTAAPLGFEIARADPEPAGGAAPPSAQPPVGQAADQKDDTGRWWVIQLQGTDIYQYKPSMRSPYEGANSLPGAAENANTLDASLIVGLRPWKGAQFRKSFFGSCA